jgi:uncharacterized protein
MGVMVEFSMRPAEEGDRQFLYALHSATMRDVIELTWGWDDEWQRAEFDRRFAEFSVSVIEVDSHPVGGLWIEERPDALYIHELQIAPALQNRGLGTAVVETVIERAADRGLPVDLSVVPANARAMRLYERLGFRVMRVEAPFIRMRHDARCGRRLREDTHSPLDHSRRGSHTVIRPAGERDFPAELALNEESVHLLAPLTPQRLVELHRKASLHWVLEERGRVVGFVLAFREGIEHDSVNYRWFAERYPSFLYVDRVVVGSDSRGMGTGSRLYEELFAHALATGVEQVAAEFDVDPPNEASARFHARFGFHEVGRQVVPYGMKEVSLQISEPRRAEDRAPRPEGSRVSRLELKVPPDAILLLVAGLMWLAAAVTPRLAIPSALRVGAGVVLAGVGVWAIVDARVLLARADTTWRPMSPGQTSSLVTHGLYGVSRNPVYLGMYVVLLGGAVLLASPVALVLSGIFVLYLDRFQIRPEERALSAVLGAEYDDYLSRVRRWI